jgi:hypothetical protein
MPKLFTKGIEKKLQKQYEFGSDLSKQNVICKIFDSLSGWTWYIMNQSPEDPDYLWAIVKGFEIEIGSVSKNELETYRTSFPLERDLYFKEMNAEECYERLLRGEHV